MDAHQHRLDRDDAEWSRVSREVTKGSEELAVPVRIGQEGQALLPPIAVLGLAGEPHRPMAPLSRTFGVITVSQHAEPRTNTISYRFRYHFRRNRTWDTAPTATAAGMPSATKVST